MAEVRAFYWHIHHEVLCEPLTEPLENRLAYIREYKPASEQALRLRLITPVQGKLPAASDKARAAYDKARAAYNKAYEVARPALEKLHAKECPDCPWDGHTIFPKPRENVTR